MILVISPFIGLEALQKLLDKADCRNGIKVVVRWRPEDLRNNVSDINIFPYLTKRGIPLYVNQSIHLKLYVCESNVAFCTSGNLTLRGFGYGENPNIEIGCFVRLNLQDWSRIYELITKSKQVDEAMYEAFKRYLDNCPKIVPSAAPPELLGTRKTYTIASLPAMETPKKLNEYYFSDAEPECSEEEIRRSAHDLVTFGVRPGLNRSEFNQCLGDSFRKTPFVVEFVELLKAEKSLRFGAVNDWIHGKCEDVPLPYRWEVKENTRIFYNWLEYFFPEITWDRPNYSQVIYWRES